MAKPWPAAVSKLEDLLVEVVVRHAPEGWSWAHLEVSMVAELWSGSVTVTAPGRTLTGPITEGQALRILRELRHRMYVAGHGAWYSMTLDIDPDGTSTATYDFDSEPVLDPPADAAAYLRDVQRYKRKDSHVPDWLKATLDKTRTGSDSAADTFTRWLQGGL
ncbi:MAG TPA: hypothetical protein VFK68_09075 [Propionibacteriaceae bacterium]|nr:hypothetical protein [Propionibacteriaceae bacterium]